MTRGVVVFLSAVAMYWAIVVIVNAMSIILGWSPAQLTAVKAGCALFFSCLCYVSAIRR